MTKNKGLVLAIALAGLFLLPSLTSAQDFNQEKITSFDSQIIVNPDSSLLVKETIVVDALGQEIKHGIYRDFPTSYQKGLLISKVGFDLISVKKDNQNEDYHTESLDNGLRIYLGNADTLLSPGTYTYEIVYKTNRQLGYFADHDELYWNVTGNGWIFPIKKATATVILPAGITEEKIKLDGYTGSQGSQAKDFTFEIKNNQPTFTTTQTLNANEGLTIVVGFPKGFVTFPTQSQKIIYLLKDNSYLIVGLIGLMALIIFYLKIWLKVGRDPKKGTIIPEYEPPIGFSPAEMRFLQKMKFDNKAFVATIIEMAIKGLVLIKEEKAILGKKYLLVKTKKDNKNITQQEQGILEALFSLSKGEIELKNKNYEKFQAAKKVLTESLKAKIENKFFKLNLKYFLIGIAWSFATTISIFSLNANGPFPTLAIPIIVLLTIINFLFLWLLKAPTKEGRKILDQIEGFKWFLSVTEKDRMNFHNPPEKTPELFEKYLPYALALGVENKWAEQFSKVFEKLQQAGTPYVPIWYIGSGFHPGNIGGFTSSLGNSFSGAISSAATAPGSSSGFGGGAGGGGGGGGGGGW
ncbi:MAG: DUF2207 domain-containing protein [Candidatus Buchananbacteria bacterium]